jgi:hypothetical protein
VSGTQAGQKFAVCRFTERYKGLGIERTNEERGQLRLDLPFKDRNRLQQKRGEALLKDENKRKPPDGSTDVRCEQDKR